MAKGGGYCRSHVRRRAPKPPRHQKPDGDRAGRHCLDDTTPIIISLAVPSKPGQDNSHLGSRNVIKAGVLLDLHVHPFI